MKKLSLILLLFGAGCLGEEDLDLGTPATFLKYYNGGFNDVAEDIAATADGGFILLGTSEVRENEITPARFKIKLIKTDAQGNVQWKKLYPAFDSPFDSVSYKGRSVTLLKDGAGTETGYAIAGDSIQVGGPSHIRVMTVDTEGNITRATNIGGAQSIQGLAVKTNASGNLVVLGSSENPQATNNMFLLELAPDFSISWMHAYGAGTSRLANRLFIDAQSSIFWAGTVIKNNRSDIRLVKTPPNSENTLFDLPLGNPEFNEEGSNITEFGFGFAVIGTTDETGDKDILFKRLAPDGTELTSRSFPIPGQSEDGLGISATRDGGLILLGAVDTNLEIGRGGKDFILIKVNAFGDEEWRQVLGSRNDDIGNNVLSLPDGSFVVYGTTIWGGLRTMALMKTDRLGGID